MRKKVLIGVFLLVAGVAGLFIVHSMKPPSGIGEVLGMLRQGRLSYIREPYYQVFLATAGTIALVGIVQVVKGLKDRPGA